MPCSLQVVYSVESNINPLYRRCSSLVVVVIMGKKGKGKKSLRSVIKEFRVKHSLLDTPCPSKKAKVATRRERQKRMPFGEATTPQLGKRVLEFQTPPKMPPVKGNDSPKIRVQGDRRLANSTSDAVPAMPAIGTTEWFSKGKKNAGRMEIGMSEAYRGYTDTYTATDDLTLAGSFCLTAEEALRRTVARRIRWIRRDLDQTDVGRSDPVPARPLKVLPVKAPTVPEPPVETPPVQATSNKVTSMEEILTEAPLPRGFVNLRQRHGGSPCLGTPSSYFNRGTAAWPTSWLEDGKSQVGKTERRQSHQRGLIFVGIRLFSGGASITEAFSYAV
jgi:hypothetical protein